MGRSSVDKKSAFRAENERIGIPSFIAKRT